MTEEVEKRLWPLAILAVIAFACACTGAIAADRTDHSFGHEGVALVPLPAEARGIPGGIQDLARAPGGKMMAAIGVTGSDAYFQAARLNADGSLDRAFGTEGFTKGMEETPTPGPEISEIETQAEAIVVQPDGKVVLAGFQKAGSGRFQRRAPLLARYRPDGSLDSSFGNRGFVAPKPPYEPDRRHPEAGGFVLHDVAIQPGGRILAAGAQNETHGGPPAGLVIAYRPDGRVDRGFGDQGRILFPSPRDNRSTLLAAVAPLPGGGVLVAGYRHARLFLVRLTAGGRPDRAFGGGDGKVSVKVNAGSNVCCQETASVAVDRHGRILVQGEAARGGGDGIALARFTPDGVLDRSFGRNGLLAFGTASRIRFPHDVAVQGDGRIVIVGWVPKTGKSFTPDLAALRLLPDGRPDLSFGNAGLHRLVAGDRSAAFAALTQPNGRVVAAGALARQVGEERFETELLLTRFLAN